MRTVGIIAEYNPFHTGHEYHIRTAKEESGADYCVVVMSPDFVQRGEPAVFDKYTRTDMALRCGADLVLELPVCYAAGSAEYFAEGAVALLEKLNVVDVLCFGAESESTPDPDAFFQTASTLVHEPDSYRKSLKKGLAEGLTYPEARCRALPGSTDLLSSPNNILGVEYTKALLRLQSSIELLPVKRIGNGYDSEALSGRYCSALALRKSIMDRSDQSRSNGTADIRRDPLRDYIPENCLDLFCEAVNTPLTSEDFLPLLYQKLLKADWYDEILDVTEDLSDRIRSLRYTCIGKSYEEIVSLLKSRQVTEGRIRRALLHLILDIRKEDVCAYRDAGDVFYARILGFRQSAQPLLHEIRKRSSLPLLAKNADAPEVLSKSAHPDLAARMFRQDTDASHLFRGLQSAKYRLPFRSEYETSPQSLKL